MTRKNATQIAEDLQQTDSAGDRSAAIVLLGKALRRGDRFQTTWDAVGGAAGLARLMAELSVYDVRLLCQRLGNTASAEKARPERREAIGELVRLLYDGQQDDRPLSAFYQEIVPACGLQTVQDWERERSIEWTPSQLRRLSLGHPERYERKFLQEVFSPDANNIQFGAHRRLCGGNLQFSGMILSVLMTKPGEIRIPKDFMEKFTMPLLRRLLKSKYDDETRDAFLDYVIQCFQRRRELLADELHTQPRGLLQYTIQQWLVAQAGRKEVMKSRMVQLLELFPTKKRPLSLDAIHRAIITPRRASPEERYELLHLFIRHLKGYETSIEDNSAAGIAKLRGLPVENDVWPIRLFFSVDVGNGRRLFERLVRAYPNGDFLYPDYDKGSRIVLKQIRSPEGDKRGDPEVVRCVLNRKSETRSGNPAWADRARLIVEERMKKAQQSREAKDRAFWAKSAFSLCIATGNLQMFRDMVLWARRFNKDPLTVKELYDASTLGTRETEDLLGAIPQCDTPAAAAATSASVARDIELANKGLVDLFETAAMGVQEPGFDRSRWLSVLNLPKAIADRRVKNAKNLNQITDLSNSKGSMLEVTETLWKPTMDTLLEVEALLYRPTSKALLGYSSNVEVSGVYVLAQIPDATQSMPAELAKFLLERMKERLGLDRLRVQMWSVVQIVMRVAKSDQPNLACPFIRDLIMDGDDNSSWHRQLINVSFLSSLPAKAARDFLHTVADAMKDKMREQNSRPMMDNKGKPRASAIKVTTIKMMAQLLQNNVFINAFSSCDILTGLLAEARHIDAKITIVGSLISTLEVPGCPLELRTRILDTFEAYVVPTSSQLSERWPLTDADWAAATDSQGVLPDIGEEAPLLGMMVTQVKNTKLNPDDKARIAQFIVSALEKSAVNNSRWMNLFLTKNGFTLEANADEELPMCPVKPGMLASFFEDWIDYIPASIFRTLCAVIISNIEPPPGIARLTESVKANPELVNSNAGKHWLSQFDNPGIAIFRLGLAHALNVLQNATGGPATKPKDTKGVSVRMVQDFVLSAAEKIVVKGDNASLYSLVSRLGHRRFEGVELWKSWRSNCVPLLREIIAMIETIRQDRANQRADTTQRNRTPLVLPDTFRLSIMTLPIPYNHPSSRQPASAEEVDTFIVELSELIDELAGRREPYHRDFALLKEEVMTAHRKADSANFALRLESLHGIVPIQEPTLGDYLRLEIVGDFLLTASEPLDKEVVNRVGHMVRGWKDCDAEGLRAIAFSIEEKLRGLGKQNPFALD